MKSTSIGKIADVQTGPFGSQLHKEDYVLNGTPIVTVEHLGQKIFTTQNLPCVSDKDKERLAKYTMHPGDIIFSRVGSVDRCSYATVNNNGWLFSGRCLRLRVTDDDVESEYLYYYFCQEAIKELIRNHAVGATMPSLNTKLLSELPFTYPEKNEQTRIISLLSNIDAKIERNAQINQNLEAQAQAIFDKMFPNISSGNKCIGDMMKPKRGKGLLSKDAIGGNVPVVAGGLEPATFHNVANTSSPVLAISASGANAGYVSLWNIPIWSSDSSYIDSSMTANVYFWYMLLKMRQQEIYDAQTGSAQPHIYPQHIAQMPLSDLCAKDIDQYTKIVTPIFETIGYNKLQNSELSSLRDTLLPKLMSGEIDVSEVAV